MSAPSPIDSVLVEAFGQISNPDVFNFGDWTSLTLKLSLTSPSEVSFELGDDTGYDRVAPLIGLGALFRVLVNDRPCLTGRVELLNSVSDAPQSNTQRFVIRTRLTDAAYNSAPHHLRFKNVSIKSWVLGCYEAIGVDPEFIVFRGDVMRDLMTGKDSRGRAPPVSLEPLKEEQAKVNPPESVFDAVDRHLRRHGLMHWDGPNNNIIVAAPDDEQEPIASLWLYRGTDGQFNNCLSIDRTQDVSQSPTSLAVFGIGGKADFTKARVGAKLINDDLVRRGFRRDVIITDSDVRTNSLAFRRSRREFAERNRSLDRLTIVLDGLSYREGNVNVNWAPDTVVDVVADHLGGALGPYFVEDVELSRSATTGDRTTLTVVRKGVWQL